MSTLRYELFGEGAALASCEMGGSGLVLIFPDKTEGFIRIGARIYKLISAKAEISPTELEDGAHIPHLFTSQGEYKLPGFEKNGKTLSISMPTGEEVRSYELKLKRLSRSVLCLENQITELKDMIRTTSLF